MIYIYKHDEEELTSFQKALGLMNHSVDEVRLYNEAQRDFLVYQSMLEEIGSANSIVMVKSLESICSGKEYIPASIRKILSSQIVLLVIDYPVMLNHPDLVTNHLLLQLLLEVHTKPKTKLVDLRAEKSKRIGRRKIRYPDNWPELYDKWQAGEITGKDFMKATGIKRGTFYHMAAEYKEYLHNQQTTDGSGRQLS